MMLTAFTQKTWLLTSSGLNHPPANLLYFQSPFTLTAFCTCLSLLNILALSFKSPLWADSLKSTDATRREFPQAPPIPSHWSTSVQTTCTSPSSLYEWQVCEPKANFLPYAPDLPSHPISEIPLAIFPSSLHCWYLAFCAMILIRIKKMPHCGGGDFSLWFFFLWIMPHFSAPIYSKNFQKKKNLYLLFLSSLLSLFLDSLKSWFLQCVAPSRRTIISPLLNPMASPWSSGASHIIDYVFPW